jgi:hypothetical protein
VGSAAEDKVARGAAQRLVREPRAARARERRRVQRGKDVVGRVDGVALRTPGKRQRQKSTRTRPALTHPLPGAAAPDPAPRSPLVGCGWAEGTDGGKGPASSCAASVRAAGASAAGAAGANARAARSSARYVFASAMYLSRPAPGKSQLFPRHAPLPATPRPAFRPAPRARCVGAPRLFTPLVPWLSPRRRPRRRLRRAVAVPARVVPPPRRPRAARLRRSAPAGPRRPVAIPAGFARAARSAHARCARLRVGGARGDCRPRRARRLELCTRLLQPCVRRPRRPRKVPVLLRKLRERAARQPRGWCGWRWRGGRLAWPAGGDPQARGGSGRARTRCCACIRLETWMEKPRRTSPATKMTAKV